MIWVVWIFFPLVHSQIITATKLSPSSSISACSSDQTVYRFQFTLDALAFSQMNSKTINVRIEFPSEYRMSANVSNMPLQWNGITTSFVLSNTSNPILSFTVAPFNLLTTNNLTIFSSNCLFTPFTTGPLTFPTVFSWTGFPSLTSNTSVDFSNPILKVIPTLQTPLSNAASCLDLDVLTTCAYFAPSASLELADPRGGLTTPSLVKVNGLPHAAVTASPSSIAIANLGSLALPASTIKVQVCSVPTPRAVGVLCGLQASLRSDKGVLATAAFCLNATQPNAFAAVRLQAYKFAVMQQHDLVVEARTGLLLLPTDVMHVRLASDFALGRRSLHS
jgi:hypothetical protein